MGTVFPPGWVTQLTRRSITPVPQVAPYQKIYIYKLQITVRYVLQISPKASLMVPNFTISAYGSSCNFLFFGLILSSLLSLQYLFPGFSSLSWGCNNIERESKWTRMRQKKDIFTWTAVPKRSSQTMQQTSRFITSYGESFKKNFLESLFKYPLLVTSSPLSLSLSSRLWQYVFWHGTIPTVHIGDSANDFPNPGLSLSSLPGPFRTGLKLDFARCHVAFAQLASFLYLVLISVKYIYQSSVNGLKKN